MVVGGFERDTPRQEIVKFMKQMLFNQVTGIDELFAYNFGSVGFARFKSRDDMFNFITDFSAKHKPTIHGKQIWVTTSKSPEERAKAKHLGKFKKVLIETALADPEDIKVDYKRGFIFVKKVIVAEWTLSGNAGKVVADASKLQEANINVDPEKIHDAVRELLQQ